MYYEIWVLGWTQHASAWLYMSMSSTMMLAVKHFEASLDTRGLDKKIQDLDRTEASTRRDFKEKMEKLEKKESNF